MSRIFYSSFRQTVPTSPRLSQDALQSHSERPTSISMRNLSPSPSRSPAASPSPPPSFYRSDREQRSEAALSPSPSRAKGKGKTIQFAGPPPPIASSVLLPRGSSNGSQGSSPRLGDGASNGAGEFSNNRSIGVVRSRRGSGGLDPFVALSRRERALQRKLQELLDAQSAGLIQGFGGQDEGSEAGSSTPTYDSTRSTSASRRVVPVRQPRKKTLGLRGARRGLLRDMSELAAIKDQEVDMLSDSIAQRENVLKKVGVWEHRIQEFQKQLSAASNITTEDEGGRDLVELRNEESAIENDIREMEDRLAQMRARRRWIQERVREGENKREARLSSYRGALREVEGEVREFLRRPPVLPSFITIEEDAEGGGFMDLPVSRRTLGMAQELWNREIRDIEARRAETSQEKEALEQGARIWEEAAKAVMEFEDKLRVQMKGSMQDPEMLRQQVTNMGSIIGALEGHLKVAEEKGWNLLICALGAELEAFREGEGILRGALGMFEANGGGKLLDDGSEVKDAEVNGLDGLDRGDTTGAESRQNLDREDSEDDGPPGELLVDQSHVDRESGLD